jgi:hypothetical protein
MPTTTLSAPRQAVPRPPRFDHRRIVEGASRLVIPSWVLSLVVHALLLTFLGQTLWRPGGFGQRGGRGDGPIGLVADRWNGADGLLGDGTGQPQGEGVGMFLGSAATAPRSGGASGADEATPDEETVARARRPANDERRADEGPPVELDLPAAPLVATAGPGAAARTQFAGPKFSDARQMLKSSGNSRLSGRGAGSGVGDASGTGGGEGGGGKGGFGGGSGGTGEGRGGGGTSFFGHRALGRRFVYVLDASGSMYDYNAIAVAKAELLASLSQLDENQQFQIIFYNDKCHPMRDSERRENLFWGTETNRTRASQFIRNIEPDGGTRHLDALLAALSYSPDVIFFLTDAGEPILWAKDLDQIKRRNMGRATIFTIEFGKGANLRTDNFLKQLARENGGAHAYRDVQEFLHKPDRRRGE